MKKDETGTALITAIMVMAMVSSLVAVCLTLATNEGVFVRSHLNSIQAVYLAEAGAEKATAKLKQHQEWEGSENLGAGSYQVDLASNGEKVELSPDGKTRTTTKFYIIESSAQVGKVRKKVTLNAQMKIIETSGGLEQSENIPLVFKKAIFSGGLVDGKKITVNGDLVSNGSVNLKNCIINGNVAEKAGLTIPPLLESSYSSGETLPNLVYKKGVYTLGNNLNLSGGIYVVNGDLNISNNVKISGKGTIYVKGNINIGNNVEFQDTNGSFAVLATNNITCRQNAVFNGGVLYAQNIINIENNVRIAGSVVAGYKVNADNNSIITYDENKIKTDKIKIPGSSSADDSFPGGNNTTKIFTVTSWQYN